VSKSLDQANLYFALEFKKGHSLLAMCTLFEDSSGEAWEHCII